jgi:uncharacterized phiE125 gp8 family phage protein
VTLTLFTAPSEEPIDLDEAKAQCRVDGSDEDALIQGYIVAAREYTENITGRQSTTATWDLGLDDFPCSIDMPKAPLQSVTSISYLDAAGVIQTLAPSNYKVVGAFGTGEPNPTAARGRITLPYGTMWPPTRCEANSVTVRFVAGYGTADKVPMALKQAMLLLISLWYRNREAAQAAIAVTPLPMAVDALLGPYRTWPIGDDARWKSGSMPGAWINAW